MHGSTRVGNLHFTEGIMNKHIYVNILRDHLKASAKKLGILENFEFYHDNDPKHSSHLVRQWCLYNCPKINKTTPQLPD
jgi:hypothetical protein